MPGRPFADGGPSKKIKGSDFFLFWVAWGRILFLLQKVFMKLGIVFKGLWSGYLVNMNRSGSSYDEAF